MGVIKTALEIALEKTETVKGDKSGIDRFEAKQKGKKLANAYLAAPSAADADLAEELKKAPAEQKESMKNGIFDILISQIALPSDKEDEKRLERTGNGLAAVIGSKQFTLIYKQLMQVFSQYLQEAAQYEQAIRQQYSPRLRQKEEELSRRLGREVHIDQSQDPEYIAFFNQHFNALKGRYEPVIEQVKEEIRKFFAEES